MRLHFRLTELVQSSLFVNRSWHQALGFRFYMSVLKNLSGTVFGRIEKLGDTKLR